MTVTSVALAATRQRAQRWCAVAIAVLAWAAFFDHVRLNIGRENGDVLAGLWRQARFFTEITNVYVALTFSAIAFGRPNAASLRNLGGLALAVTLVAVVYWAVLHGATRQRPTWDAAFNVLIHGIIPLSVVLYTLTMATPDTLQRADAVKWTFYPLAYLIYALARGQFDGRPPYFFLDSARIGGAKVMMSVTMIAAVYMLAGAALVGWDQRRRARLSA